MELEVRLYLHSQVELFWVRCIWRNKILHWHGIGNGPVKLITKRMRYPLPQVDEMFDGIAKGKIFSRLDLNSGYHQLRVAEADVNKTAFVCPMGQLEFLASPSFSTRLFA